MTVFPGGGSLPLAPPYATGLLLIGLAPAAPFLPIMVRRAGAIGRAIVGSVAEDLLNRAPCDVLAVPP